MIESFPKQLTVMFKLPSILACAIFSAHTACAAAAEKYSVIPEPGKTELQQNSTRTLKLLSDREAPSLGTAAYRLSVTPQGAHLASGGREGRIYGLATLRQLRDQLAEQPEGIPCGVITDEPRYPRRGISSPSRTWKNSWTSWPTTNSTSSRST